MAFEQSPASRAPTAGSLAREHLTRAAAMDGEMDMGFWLEKAETALGPAHGNSP